MDKDAKIYIAGHKGLVGSALARTLQAQGYKNIIFRTSNQVDLRNQQAVEELFCIEKPAYVFLAAAKVGGIIANSSFPAEFIYDNIMISANVIHAAYKYGVKKLLNLGSTCIYPRLAPQPLKEEYLLTAALEPTNEAYAVAKIAAVKLCQYYNQQYAKEFISIMPTNLYGPNDNFDLDTAHAVPALIRKLHLGKLLSRQDFDAIRKDFQSFGLPKKFDAHKDIDDKKITMVLADYGISAQKVILLGTGKPYREFLHVDDAAQACIFVMDKCSVKDTGPLINIGTGHDLQINQIAEIVRSVVEYTGSIGWDPGFPDGTPKKLTDISRITELGWKPQIEFLEGIKSVYQWYKLAGA